MSAETLRKAAEKLREQATDAVSACGDDPWCFEGIGWNDVQGTTFTIKAGPVRVAEADCEEQAVYIATMHPGVGLALADVLDESAAVWDDIEDAPRPDSQLERLARLARLILGGDGS